MNDPNLSTSPMLGIPSMSDQLFYDQISDNTNKDLGQLDDSKKETQQRIDEKVTYGTIDLSSGDLRQRAYLAVMNRKRAVQSQHDELVAQCDKWEQMWKVGTVDKNKDTLANVGSMDVWNSVEDWTAFIMDAMFGVDPMLDVEGRKKKLDNELSRRIKGVLLDIARQGRIEDEGEIGIREGVKLGTLTFKTPYQFSEEAQLVIKQRPKIFNLGFMQVPTGAVEDYVETEIKVDDRPVLKWVDIRNLYFRYDKKSWIIEEILSNWSEIDKQARENNVYGNLERAKAVGFPSGTESDRELKNKNKISNQPNNASNIQSLDGDVLLYEAHHIPFNFKADDPVPDELKGKKVLCIITIANNSEVIRIQATPFRKPPYLICPLFRQPGSELGIGIPQILEYLVREFNTRKNQSLDANTLGLYCMIAANMRYIKKPEQLKIRPNGRIDLKDLPPGTRIDDVISFIRPPTEYSVLAEQMTTMLQNEMSRSTRLKNVMSGEKIPKGTTATEATSMIREAFKGVKIILDRIDRNIFQEFFERAYVMCVLNRQKSWVIEVEQQQQTIDPTTGQAIAEKGRVWEEVTPQQIYSDGIDIKMLGPIHMQDEIVFQHKIMQAMDLAKKMFSGPVMNDKNQLVVFDKYKGFNDILYSLNIEDPESYWKQVSMPATVPGAIGPQPATRAPGAPVVGQGASPETPADLINQGLGGAV